MTDHAGDSDSIRPGEAAVRLPEATDAGVYFIGRIRTPWLHRRDCPRRGDPVEGPICTIELDPRWLQALEGIEAHPRLQVLYPKSGSWIERPAIWITLLQPAIVIQAGFNRIGG